VLPEVLKGRPCVSGEPVIDDFFLGFHEARR
jgi:hypothetical protein